MPDLDSIRRMLDADDPIPPWIVRGLCGEAERERDRAEYWRMQWDFAVGQGVACEERYKALLDVVSAARAWSDAIDRCDGIVAAEEQLRETLKGLR